MKLPISKECLVLPNKEQVISHARNRDYMSGVERDSARIKATGEVFTPTKLVQEILDSLPQTLFTDPLETFLDPSCGDGQFLSEILIRKMENGIGFEDALSSIYGVELMEDNAEECRKRLLCGQEQLRHIVERNIVCHNGLTYDYSFNGTNFTEQELLNQTIGLPVTSEKNNKIKKIKETLTPDLSAFDLE